MPISTSFQIITWVFGFLISMLMFFSFFALILWSITNLLKFGKKEFSTAFIVILISFVIITLISLIPLLIYTPLLESIIYQIFSNIFTICVLVLLIKYFYKENWKKTIFASIVFWIIMTMGGFLFRLFMLSLFK